MHSCMMMMMSSDDFLCLYTMMALLAAIQTKKDEYMEIIDLENHIGGIFDEVTEIL